MQSQPRTRPGLRITKRQWTLAARSIQLALVSVVVWVAISAGRGLTSAAPDSGRRAGSAISATIPCLPGGALGEGSWQFGQLACDVSIRTVRTSDLTTSLATFPSRPLANGRRTADEASLLQRVKGAMRRFSREFEQMRYALDTTSLKARVFTQVQNGEERIQGGYFAFPAAAGSWTVLVVKAPRIEQGQQGRQATLLPVPQDSKRLCARFDSEGRLSCEIVAVKCDLESLKSDWERGGWSIGPSKLPGGILVHGAAGDIQVAEMPGKQAAFAALVFVRVPTDESGRQDR